MSYDKKKCCETISEMRRQIQELYNKVYDDKTRSTNAIVKEFSQYVAPVGNVIEQRVDTLTTKLNDFYNKVTNPCIDKVTEVKATIEPYCLCAKAGDYQAGSMSQMQEYWQALDPDLTQKAKIPGWDWEWVWWWHYWWLTWWQTQKWDWPMWWCWWAYWFTSYQKYKPLTWDQWWIWWYWWITWGYQWWWMRWWSWSAWWAWWATRYDFVNHWTQAQWADEYGKWLKMYILTDESRGPPDGGIEPCDSIRPDILPEEQQKRLVAEAAAKPGPQTPTISTANASRNAPSQAANQWGIDCCPIMMMNMAQWIEFADGAKFDIESRKLQNTQAFLRENVVELIPEEIAEETA